MIVIGIDTSCDDTGVGIVENGYTIRSNVTASQHLFHERYGGIVPTVAARRHCTAINPLLEIAVEEAGIGFSGLDAVAVTSDQGLAPCLAVGLSAAKAIAIAMNIPLLGVHHVEGHIYSCLMAHQHQLDFPFLCLTVAGGHTLLLAVEALGNYQLIGYSRDDAAGEAFDKVARRIGLDYPGGPVIDRISATGNAKQFRFPRPMINDGTFDFSFSGLKTAVNRKLSELEAKGVGYAVEDVAASFQEAVVDVLATKCLRAAQAKGIPRVALAGGVAANSGLRSRIEDLCFRNDIELFSAPHSLCVDNGAMIAGVAYHALSNGQRSSMSLDARANAPLGESGVKYRHHSKYGIPTSRA